MSAAAPSVSVVVPTRDRPELLALMLAGLREQTLDASRFEVIVVSDGSSDGTDEVVREYARSCAYALRLVPQANADAIRTPHGDHGLRDLQKQTRTVLDRTAISVGSQVGTQLQELLQQIAVGAVDLDAVKAGRFRLHRRLPERLDDLSDFFGLQRPWRLVGDHLAV